MSSLLSAAVSPCKLAGGDDDQLRGELITCRAYRELSAAWPSTKEGISMAPCLQSALLATRYYIASKPTHGSSDFDTELLVMGESHAKTPESIEGLPIDINNNNKHWDESFPESEAIKSAGSGHINLVHCLSYGEPWLLNEQQFQQLSRGERLSVSTGTRIFWQLLLVLSGGCDDTAGGDMLLDVDLYDNAFRQVSSARRHGVAPMQRLVQKHQVMEAMRKRRIALIDLCPLPIYSGAGKTEERTNLKTGKKYRNRVKDITPREVIAIMKVAWETYAKDLIKMFKPRRLLILGKTIHKAIGKDEIQSFLEGIGAEYVLDQDGNPFLHPSYNRLGGRNAMPYWRKIRAIAKDTHRKDTECKEMNMSDDAGVEDVCTAYTDDEEKPAGSDKMEDSFCIPLPESDEVSIFRPSPESQDHNSKGAFCKPSPKSNDDRAAAFCKPSIESDSAGLSRKRQRDCLLHTIS